MRCSYDVLLLQLCTQACATQLSCVLCRMAAPASAFGTGAAAAAAVAATAALPRVYPAGHYSLEEVVDAILAGVGRVTASEAMSDEEAVRVVTENRPSILAVLEATNKAMDALPKAKRDKVLGLQWHQLLGVPASACIRKSESAMSTIPKIRTAFATYGWIDRTGLTAAAPWLESCVVCQLCRGTSDRSGVVVLRGQTLDEHPRGKGHIKAVEALVGTKRRQVDLGEAGMAREASVKRGKLATELVVGSFLAGGEGAAGVPYTAVPKLLDEHTLRLISYMRSGVPSAPTIAHTTAPTLVSSVKEYIKPFLTGNKFALAIDGGSCSLAGGAKVIAVTAVSPALPHDMLLGVHLLLRHEDADKQASILRGLCEEYGFQVKDVPFLAADNAAVNTKTCKLLEEGGWHIQHARCLPHCLNLVIVTFVAEFDALFAMSTNLRDIRAFIKAGGATSRRAVLVEWGLTLSRVDFADTRWEGFVKAVCYMMTMQSKSELAAARRRLAELAEEGDTTATDALEDPGVPQMHWNAFYEAIESMDVEDRGSSSDIGGATTRRDAILQYNANIINFGAFMVLSKVLGGVPALFRMIQGSAQWTTRVAEDAASRTTAVEAVQELVDELRRLQSPVVRQALVAEVADAARAQQAEMMRRAVEYREATGAQVTAATVRERFLDPRHAQPMIARNHKPNTGVQAALEANVASLTAALNTALISAATAVAKCRGLEKLEESLAALKLRQRFALVGDPEPLTAAGTCHAFFGLPKPDHSLESRLSSQWHRHTSALARVSNEDRAKLEHPQQVYEYWRRQEATMPELSSVALTHWVRPISSASVERVFSTLTNMDDAQRQRMTGATLTSMLFLRANWRIMHTMKRDAALRVVSLDGRPAALRDERLDAMEDHAAGTLIDLVAAASDTHTAGGAGAPHSAAEDSVPDDDGEALFDPL